MRVCACVCVCVRMGVYVRVCARAHGGVRACVFVGPASRRVRRGEVLFLEEPDVSVQLNYPAPRSNTSSSHGISSSGSSGSSRSSGSGSGSAGTGSLLIPTADSGAGDDGEDCDDGDGVLGCGQCLRSLMRAEDLSADLPHRDLWPTVARVACRYGCSAR